MKGATTLAEAIVAFGSNLGNRTENINRAIEAINLLPETSIIDTSNFYETEPFGVPDAQNNYINLCAKVSTDLSPQILLGCLLGIESAMGRKRPYRFCSRIIDLDLIFYENQIINEKNLTLPHPRALERAFVLVPMHDLCKNGSFGEINFSKEYEKCDKSKTIPIK